MQQSKNGRDQEAQDLFADYGKAIRSIQKQKRNKEVEKIRIFENLFKLDIKSLLFEDEKTVINMLEEDVLRDVPLKFECEKSYENIFHPLIFQELKDCLVRDAKLQKLSIRLSGRLVSKKKQKKKYAGVEEVIFKVLVKKIPFESQKKYYASKFHTLCKRNKFRELFEILRKGSDVLPNYNEVTMQKGDILLLTKDPPTKSFENMNGFLGVVSRAFRLNAEFVPPKALSREVFLDVILSYSLLVPLRAQNSARKHLYKTPLFFSRVGNLITSWREHNAVVKMTKQVRSENILKKALFTATSDLVQEKKEVLGVSDNYDSFLKANFNDSQYQAILSCVRKTAGFCLIQGPPGTGKTHTLVGLLNTLHINEFQKYYSARLNRVKGVYKTDDVEMMKKPRILVTAPSNAAVREVCKRILTKLFVDDSKKRYNPNVVWFANAEKQTIGQDEEKILLERQVETYVNVSAEKVESYERQLKLAVNQLSDSVNKKELQVQAAITKLSNLRQDLEHTSNIDSIRLNRDDIRRCIQESDKNERELIAQWEKLDRKIMKLQCYQIVKSSMSFKEKQRQIRVKILKGAEIVLTTLSSSAVSELKYVGKKEGFNVVVVDEAAQSVEPQVLIPLQYSCQKCVLVGDHMQLPATVVSETAKSHFYEQSLFERLLKAKHPYHILRVQYRCHPKIASFVSQHFYQKKLINGDNVTKDYSLKSSERGKIFDSQNLTGTFDYNRVFSPLAFFNFNAKEQKMKDSTSFYNDIEVNAVTKIYTYIRSQPELKTHKIGIISPYSMQISRIRSKIFALARHTVDKNIEINTVDGFQGREFDIVILSSVRAKINDGKNSKSKCSVGFLNDQRRLNVGITRAKYSLIVVGNQEKLRFSVMWNSLIKYIKSNGKYKDLRSGSQSDWKYLFKSTRKPTVEDLNIGLFHNLWGQADIFVDRAKKKKASQQVVENLSILSNLPADELETLEGISSENNESIQDVEEGEIR